MARSKRRTRFWANVVITALRDSSGQLRGFAKVTRGHDRKARERAGADQGKELLELSK